MSEIPSCKGCPYMKQVEGGYLVMSCNPMRGMRDESCLMKWVGTQVYSLRLAIERMKTGSPSPGFQKKMEELIDRQLKEMRKGNEWETEEGDNPSI